MLAATAPIGTAPFVRPLAIVIMSGVTPKCCARERRAEATEAGDHLVEDQQDAVLRADLAQPLQVALGRDQHAGRTRDGLDDHGGDVAGVVQRDEALEFVGEVRAVLGLAARVGVAGEVVRVRQVVDARQHRAEQLAVVDHAADGDAAETDAVIAALPTDEARARAFAARAVIGQRDLERGVDRLRAGVREEDVVEALRAASPRPSLASSNAAGCPIWNGGAYSIVAICALTASAISLRPWPALTHQRPATASRICRPSGVQ